MMTIGASQFLPDTLSFILPRNRVHPHAIRAQINTSKTSPVISRLLSLRFGEPVTRLRHSVSRCETGYRELAEQKPDKRVSRDKADPGARGRRP